MYHRCSIFAIYLSIFVLHGIVFVGYSCSQSVISIDAFPSRLDLSWLVRDWFGPSPPFPTVWRIQVLGLGSICHEFALVERVGFVSLPRRIGRGLRLCGHRPRDVVACRI